MPRARHSSPQSIPSTAVRFVSVGVSIKLANPSEAGELLDATAYDALVK